MMDELVVKPIGVVHSPFQDPKGTPIQPTGGRDVSAQVEILPEYAEGLKDLDGFSHIFLIYQFHRTKGPRLLVTPFMDDELRGVFSTRAPTRPNPIGLSVVELVRVEGSTLHIKCVDVLDGTPVLDVKPYVPEVDSCGDARVGWLASAKDRFEKRRADHRFTE
jgi:tRNA-Thr(GGU) m(6)t(6)A37 methyltransferase TsaA